VQQATLRKLAVVLNMHHYDDAVLKPAEHEARFLALWRQIAEHYKRASPDVYLEVFNEPHDIGDSAWNELLAQAIATIRAVDPQRTLIVGPVDWYSYRRLNDLKLPEDDRNLIVSFHYYAPFEFTHQGAEWVNGSDKWLGRTWDGTTAQRDDIEFELNAAATWGKTNNRPLYLGEFGAYSKADMASRARWTAYVARQAEARQMSWAYWEFRSGFGVYDGQAKHWNELLRRALLPAG
jgi:endoglucanase